MAKKSKKRSGRDLSSTRSTKKSALSEAVEVESDVADASSQNDPCLSILEQSNDHVSSERVTRLEKLFENEKYDDTIEESTKVLDTLPPLQIIAKAALMRGCSLLKQAEAKGDNISEQKGNRAAEALAEEQLKLYEQAWNAFELSNRLNPDCEETMDGLDNVTKTIEELRSVESPPELADVDFDVIVVGAGAAGVGFALMLTRQFGLEKSRVLLLERGEEVGESFRRWPAEMRFISPSFNQQGWTDSFDLNSIAYGSSPAFSLHSEHPSGNEYAAYLTAIALTNKLQIRRLTEVTSVTPKNSKRGDEEEEQLPLFSVEVRSVTKEGKTDGSKTETLTARYVVWAAGEFQYPKDSTTSGREKSEMALVGSEYCIHNSQVRSWAKLPGNDFVVIGGYESGVDAAVNLAKAGKKCKILASTPCWSVKTSDPSTELAPYTAGRLRNVLAPGFSPQPDLFAPLRVVKVEKAEKGGFNVHAKWLKADEEEAYAPLRDLSNVKGAETSGKEGKTLVLHTPNAPVLCTGFEGSVASIASNLFDIADENHPHKGCLGDAPLLTDDDESTKTPGVFLVGPSVQHDNLSFCFVFKFRQRFAIVANAICERLGIDTKAAVADCRSVNMFLDDFARCEEECGEVC